jgi:hypothetical protein
MPGMPNPRGHSESLAPAPRGNTRNLQSGAFSKRIIGERASEIADGLMELPWAQGVDRLAAEEVASVLSALEAIDRALSDGRVEYRGNARGLLGTKATLTRELRAWLTVLGATPHARAEWAAKLGEPSFKEAVEARIARMREEANGGQR